MAEPVRVAMDVSALTAGLRSGTAVYVYRLVEALAELDGLELDLLYNGMPGRGVDLARSLERPRVRVLVETFRWRVLPGPLFPRPYPRALAETARAADVFHVGEFVYPRPRPGQPVVATVHDVTTKLFPRWHNVPNRILHHRRLRWIGRHATRVIIDAEATRADSARVLGLPPDRLDVVPLARGTRPAASGRSQLPAALSDLRSCVLYVGTLEPRKNVARLVEACAGLPDDLADVKLVLAGGWGWHTGPLRRALASSGARGRTIVTGAVDDAVLDALYARATVFAYPSLYEGFGLPVLEAMAAGAPVVTSRGGTLEEVAGDAAVLVDPADIGALREALARLLRDPAERERLARRGREREAGFTWRRTAERTLAVWRRAAREAA